MLMKTYVDQIAREEKKLKVQQEVADFKEEVAQPGHHKKGSISRKQTVGPLVTRNNEGKVCTSDVKRAKTAGLKKLKTRFA